MDADAIFAASAARRRAVADLLDGLDESQLSVPSLCSGWDVRTVAGHLAAAVHPSKVAFTLAALRAAGNLHRANDTVARTSARRPPGDLADELRRHADSRFAPPLVGPRGPLTDVLVHEGDMRVPLGLDHDPEAVAVRWALEFVTEGRPVGFVRRGRVEGLRLVADDLDWSWGDGARLHGRGVDVLMAVCGRAAVVSRLGGPGAQTLAARMP